MVPGSPAVSGDLRILFADLQGRIEEEATIMVPAGIRDRHLWTDGKGDVERQKYVSASNPRSAPMK